MAIKILVSCFTGIGNGLQMTPMLRLLATFAPNCQVYVMGDNASGVLGLLDGLPFISGIRYVPLNITIGNKLELLKWMNSKCFDALFHPFTSTPGWLYPVALMSNAKLLVQHVNLANLSKSDWFIIASRGVLGRRIRLVPFLQGRHEIELNFDLAEVYFNRPIDRNPSTELHFRKDESVLERFKLPSEYICLQPGAANGSLTPKKWPAKSFMHFIGLVRAQYPSLGFVTVGCETEMDSCVRPLLRGDLSIVNTAGMTKLNDLVNILAAARAVVCHDSGIMHIANALDLPVVALYGPTDYTRTAPRGARSRFIRKTLDCAPCMYRCGLGEKEILLKCVNPECMQAIDSYDVFSVMREILG